MVAVLVESKVKRREEVEEVGRSGKKTYHALQLNES